MLAREAPGRLKYLHRLAQLTGLPQRVAERVEQRTAELPVRATPLLVLFDCPLVQANGLFVGEGYHRPVAGPSRAFNSFRAIPGNRRLEEVICKLAEMIGGMPDQIVVIGDTMETDIRGAIEAGLQAYLVLSGSTSVEQVADYVYQPTRVLSSVTDLIEEIKSGTPSNRLDSPVYTHGFSRSNRLGRRHQTDAEHPAKPRPRAPMTTR